jgi:hypothetical protein
MSAPRDRHERRMYLMLYGTAIVLMVFIIVVASRYLIA